VKDTLGLCATSVLLSLCCDFSAPIPVTCEERMLCEVSDWEIVQQIVERLAVIAGAVLRAVSAGAHQASGAAVDTVAGVAQVVALVAEVAAVVVVVAVAVVVVADSNSEKGKAMSRTRSKSAAVSLKHSMSTF